MNDPKTLGIIQRFTTFYISASIRFINGCYPIGIGWNDFHYHRIQRWHILRIHLVQHASNRPALTSHSLDSNR
jgi:hypothetical protein